VISRPEDACSVLIVRSQEESAQFRKILIGYDGSPGAELALRHSILLAKQLGSEAHVIWVHQSQGRVSDTTKERAENDAAEQHFKEHFLPQIKAVGEASDIRVHSMFKVGNVAQSIISEAERGGFRIVALGHRGSSGIWGRFLGGVADRVSDQAHCDVLIVRQLS
jgi:nucleotide-binding universal stress UspA family protein